MRGCHGGGGGLVDAFVPVLFPRFTGARSGADEELCGWLYKGGFRYFFLSFVGEGEDEVVPVMPAGCLSSGVLVRKDLCLTTSCLQKIRPRIRRSRRPWKGAAVVAAVRHQLAPECGCGRLGTRV